MASPKTLEKLNQLWESVQKTSPNLPASLTSASNQSLWFLQNGLEDFSFDCSKCTRFCCENHLGIKLLLRDVAVLIDHGLEENISGSFASRESIENLNKNPGAAKGIQLPGIVHINKRCKFFNQEKKCSTYAFRPLLCQTYPFNLEIEQNNKKIYYKFSTLTGCPFHLQTEVFHLMQEVSPWLRSQLDLLIQERLEIHKTFQLLRTHRQELAEIGFEKYLGEGKG